VLGTGKDSRPLLSLTTTVQPLWNLAQPQFEQRQLISRAGDEFRTVEILCEKFHARMILAVAEMFCPEAAAEIEEAIKLSRTLN
jgi:hypothetical protein